MKYFGLEMSLVYEVLVHLEFKIHIDFKTISSLCVVNCFKYFLVYILGQNVSEELDIIKRTISSLMCQIVLNIFQYLL